MLAIPIALEATLARLFPAAMHLRQFPLEHSRRIARGRLEEEGAAPAVHEMRWPEQDLGLARSGVACGGESKRNRRP